MVGQECNTAVQMPHANFVSRLLYLPRGISRLEKLGQRKVFPKNHMLVQAGTKPTYCYIVKTGRVAAFETTVTGEERIYNFNESNSVLLEGNLLFDQESAVNFKTVQPSELVCITKEMLLKGIAHDPQLSMDIMESLSTKFLSAMEQVRHTNFHNAGWKICDLLLIFAEHYGVPYDGKILIKEKISQQLLSNLLGINRVTAVRAIKDLKEMALIEQINGYYCIRSLEKLKRHQERMCQ